MTNLTGERVTLRPLREEDFPAMRAAHEAGIASIAKLDPAGERRLRRRVERSGAMVDGWLDLGIEAEGRLVGDVGARRPAGALPPGVFEIGIELYDEADRGKGYGGEAVRLITHHLFADHEAERVQASTDVTNAAMRRALERAGYSEEGVMRWFRDGGNGSRDDYVLYAVTKPDWTRG
jgi:RimJ/RimL family protein N-acetyltransferase